MHNQTKVAVFQKNGWLSEREKLFDRVEQFCNHHNFYLFSSLENLQIKNCPATKLVHFWQGDLLPDLTYWKQVDSECSAVGKTVTVISDNILNFPNLNNVFFYSYPELNGVMSMFDIPLDTAAEWKKLYNCFMQRVESVRQSWFYFLHQHNLLDKGYVSFLLKQLSFYSDLTGQELFSYIHEKYQLGQLPHFDRAYQETYDMVPYRNFEETGDVNKYIMASKYSLVLDTYAPDDGRDQWYFSEKSLRSVQFPNYSLLFVQQGGIAVLEKLGLRFATSLIYLDDLPWQGRQQHLLSHLINNHDDVNKTDLVDIAMHNQNIFKSWKSTYDHQNYFDKVFEHLVSH
jgi:hypothetical protein